MLAKPKTTAKMVRPVGIEPTAYRSEVCRSIQLSYERIISINLRFKVLFFKHFNKHIFGKCLKQRAIKPLSSRAKNSLKAKLYHFFILIVSKSVNLLQKIQKTQIFKNYAIIPLFYLLCRKTFRLKRVLGVDFSSIWQKSKYQSLRR